MKLRLIVIFFALLFAPNLYSQANKEARDRGIPNLPNYDYQRIHFGFLVGFAILDAYIHNSGLATAENGYIPQYAEVNKLQMGLTLGIVNDLKIVNGLNLRALPGISFGERKVDYINALGEVLEEGATIKSTFIDLPVLLKYSAFRLNNIKPFIVGGTTFRYDLAKDKKSHLKTRPFDVYGDAGAGMDFYLPYFRFSIEFRASFGLRDIFNHTLSEEPADIPYQQAIDKIHSRFYGITFYFE